MGAPAERPLRRYVVQAHYPGRYWEHIADTDDENRALLEALKRARVGKVAYRVWDRKRGKEVWRGSGHGAVVEKWKEKRPEGLVGANARKYRYNLHSKEERQRLEGDVLAQHGLFKGAISKGRVEEASRILGWFQGVTAAAVASGAPPFYVGRLRVVTRRLDRMLPEHPRRAAPPPPEAWLNPRGGRWVVLGGPGGYLAALPADRWRTEREAPASRYRGYKALVTFRIAPDDTPADKSRKVRAAYDWVLRTHKLAPNPVVYYTLFAFDRRIGMSRQVGKDYTNLAEAKRAALALSDARGVEIEVLGTDGKRHATLRPRGSNGALHNPSRRARGNPVGTVEDLRYTRSGYQKTKIDGKWYATLFDLGTHPVAVGRRVEYAATGKKADVYDMEYARIVRVLSNPERAARRVKCIGRKCRKNPLNEMEVRRTVSCAECHHAAAISFIKEGCPRHAAAELGAAIAHMNDIRAMASRAQDVALADRLKAKYFKLQARVLGTRAATRTLGMQASLGGSRVRATPNPVKWVMAFSLRSWRQTGPVLSSLAFARVPYKYAHVPGAPWAVYVPKGRVAQARSEVGKQGRRNAPPVLKWAPSQVWAAAKRAGLPHAEWNVVVEHYLETGQLPGAVREVIKDWPAPPPSIWPGKAKNPLTRREAAKVLRRAHGAAATARRAVSEGYPVDAAWQAGQAWEAGGVVARHGPKAAELPAVTIRGRALRAKRAAHANPHAGLTGLMNAREARRVESFS